MKRLQEVCVLVNFSASGNGSLLTDSELARLYASGSECAFTALMDRYMGLIRSITAKYRVSGLDPDDLTQEGLLGLMCAAKSFRGDGGASFRTYASLCMNRRVISLLKRSGNDKSKALNDYVSFDDEAFAKMSGGVNPEDMYISNESLTVLNTAIKELLTEKEQRVLRLYLAGKRYTEIADELDMSRKSVDNAMTRVRKKLKDYIAGISL